MNQSGRKIYGFPMRLLTAGLAAVVLIVGQIGLRTPSGGSEAYGLSVSDLAEYPGAGRAELSEGAANIVKRGRQMYEITWTALGDIISYPGTGQELIFREGAAYQGIPYGQPVHKGKYVGFNATLEEFAAAAADADSEFYTELGENTWEYTEGLGEIKYAPFYSSDCSAFISYVWQLPGRYTTSMIAERTFRRGEEGYSDAEFQYVGSSVSDLQVGYALNKGSSHIILIYDIVYDRFGEILQVTTLEQTPPIMRLRIWGAGGNAGSLQDLQNKIDTAPYEIIRYKDMEKVTFEASAAVPLDSENYINRISEPVSASVSDEAVTGSAALAAGVIPIEGWTYHKNGVSAVEYCVDGEAWQTADTEVCGELLRFRAETELTGSGAHTISVRGTSAGETYEIAQFTVNIGMEPVSYISCFDLLGTFIPSSTLNEPLRTEFSLGSPEESSLTFSGWALSMGGVKGYEYKIDDGLWIPLEAGFRQDVYRSMKNYQEFCDVYNQFSGGLGFSNFAENSTHTIYMRGITDTNDVFDIAQIEVQLGARMYQIFGLEISRAVLLAAGGGLVLLIALAAVLIAIGRKRRHQKNTEHAVPQKRGERAPEDGKDRKERCGKETHEKPEKK